MRIILFGNAGAGKSTLAARLLANHPGAHLSLDEVAFAAGAQRRPLSDSIRDVERWILAHDSWVIEGCYADIIEALLGHCDELIFLNPGTPTCLAHCRARPWEPEKFASPEEQQARLENLLEWVARYESRTDEYGLAWHRRLFERFAGNKRELRLVSDYHRLSPATERS